MNVTYNPGGGFGLACQDRRAWGDGDGSERVPRTKSAVRNMLRAVDREGQSYVAPDYEAIAPARLAEVRQRCRQDELECPWCNVPVIIRAGEVRIWHFAHKILAECPYQDEAVARQLGRLLLYKWLCAKLGDGAVSLEAEMPGVNLPLPLDVLVDTKRVKAGYWYLHKNIRSRDVRDSYWSVVRGSATSDCTRVHVIHDTKSAKVLDAERNLVRLSTTHLESLERTDFDGLHGRRGGTIHLLDCESERVLTYRAIRHNHGTSYEYGAKLETPLCEMLLRPTSGELVHPGEHERLQTSRLRTALDRAPQENLRHQRSGTAAPGRKRGGRRGELRDAWRSVGVGADGEDPRGQVPATPSPLPARPCQRCGVVTPEDEWVVYDGTTCSLCRTCSRGSAGR